MTFNTYSSYKVSVPLDVPCKIIKDWHQNIILGLCRNAMSFPSPTQAAEPAASPIN
jgi:hypothetical protein